MSIDYLNKVFKASIKPSSMKFVLVALADYANDEGEAYPSYETLQNKTSQNRKTVSSNISKLISLGYLVPTGKMVGKTQQIPVYKIILNPNGNNPKNGTVKQSQKRDALKSNSPKNGTGNNPKNGTVKQSQKRYLEPSVSFNHQLEPSEDPLTPKRGNVLVLDNQAEKRVIAANDKRRANEIFEHWQKVMNSPRSKLTDARRKIINKALKDYSSDELKSAIEGCKKSQFHMANNHNSIELICRNAEKTERFIDMNATPEATNTGSKLMDYNLSVGEQWISEAQEGK